MTIDASNMLATLEQFGEQCRTALSLPKGMLVKKPTSNIVVLGMGGSAISGDVLKSYLDHTGVPVTVSRSYSLPPGVDKDTLVFSLSYSGNTEETLSATKQALQKTDKVIAITTGGKLKDLVKKSILVPGGMMPRCAMGYLFFPMLGVAQNSGIAEVTNEELSETLTALSQIEAAKDRGRELARQHIKDKTPLIYTSELFRPVAMRWKTQVNENAKTPAFFNTFPEMNHNEIEGFLRTRPQEYCAILIRDRKEHPEVRKRMDVTRDMLEERLEVQEVFTKGESLLCRMLSTIYLGDMMSYHLALYKRIDPTPIEMIDRLKKALRE